MNDKYIYFTTQENKPVKLIFEDVETEKKYYYPEYKVVLYEFLRDLKLNRIITTQQYRSERGKLRHYKEEEVVNFLVKRGITRKQIINECNTERVKLVTKKKFPIGIINNTKFGIINL